MANIIEQKYFYWGVSEDERLWPANSISRSEWLSLNDNTKYLELAPKAQTVKTITWDCKIILEIGDDIYFFWTKWEVQSENRSWLIYQFANDHEIVCAFVFNSKLYLGTMASDSSDLILNTISVDDIGGSNWATDISLWVATIPNLWWSKSDVRFLLWDEVYIVCGRAMCKLDSGNTVTQYNFITSDRWIVAFITNIWDTYYRIYTQNGWIIEWDWISTNPTAIRDLDEIIINWIQKGSIDYCIWWYALNDTYFAWISWYELSRLVRAIPDEEIGYKNQLYTPSNQNSLAINKDNFYMIVSGENGSQMVATYGKNIAGLQNAFVPLIKTNADWENYSTINAIYVKNNTLYISRPDTLTSEIEKVILNSWLGSQNKGYRWFFITHTVIWNNLNTNKLEDFGILVRNFLPTYPITISYSIDWGNFVPLKTYSDSDDDKYKVLKIPRNVVWRFTEIKFKVEINWSIDTQFSPKIYGYYLKYS